MKVGIVGAGSIGGWVANRLARAGHEVSVLARGATLAAIVANGLVLRDSSGEQAQAVRAADDPSVLGEQDLLVIAVKVQHLPAMVKGLAPMIGPDTLVVPMLNGVPWWFGGRELPLRSVDPQGDIAATIPFRAIVGCVVHASAASPQPGVTELRFADRLILGEPIGGTSDRVDRLVAMLEEAGLPATPSSGIRQDIWYKLWGNMTMNPISALTLATADRILDDPLVERLVLDIMEEAKAIGAAIGCPIEQSGEDRNAVTRKLGAFRTSMLQDTAAGKSLELDALLAAPREIAGAKAIACPRIDQLFGLTRLMAQSRGLYTSAVEKGSLA